MKTTKLNIGGIAISIENSDPTSNKSPVLAKSSEEYLICATEAITLANVTSAVLQDMNNDNSMSREGFGEKAKAVAKKTIEVIVNFFKKIIEWCKNLIGFISQKIKNKFYEVEMTKIFKSVTKEEWDAGVAEQEGLTIKLDGFVIGEQDRQKILYELKKLLGVAKNVSDSWKIEKINNLIIGRSLFGTEFEEFKKHWEMTKDEKKWGKFVFVNDILKNIRYGDTRMFNVEYEKLKYLCNVLNDMNEMSKNIQDNFKLINFDDVDIEKLKTNLFPTVNFMSNVANELFKQELIIINNKIRAARIVVGQIKYER